MKIGQVVRSVAGRDDKRLLVVTAASPKRVWVADGKERPLARPKPKNPKHLVATDCYLESQELRSNRAIRCALRTAEKIIMNSERGQKNV